MTTLVSPGVSVTVTNDSFFVPASAPTVPLFIIATGDNKYQTPHTPASGYAVGTQENGVVRTITSLSQSVQTYGIPYFHTDANGNPQHGDARNEYGLAGLNTFLGQGNYAYVVRAGVNLNDYFPDIQSDWAYQMGVAESILAVLVNQWISNYNSSNNLSPASLSVIGTLNPPTGGTGYTPGTFLNVPLLGGTGVGATANITVSATGVVTSVVPVLPGAGYTVGNTLTSGPQIGTIGSIAGGTGYVNGTFAGVSLVGGTGSGAQATITVSGGIVTAVVLSNAGVGYVASDVLTVGGPILTTNTLVAGSGYVGGIFSNVVLTGGKGSGAKGTILVAANGIATQGTLVGGSAYTNGSYSGVPLTGGTGTGAIATVAVAGGIVTGVTITNPGSGYDVGDILSASAATIGGTGTGFTVAVATVKTYVSSVTVTSAGLGYVPGDVLTAPASSIGGTGSGFSVTVGTVGATPIGSGSGFSVTVNTVSTSALGSGTGFAVTVASVYSYKTTIDKNNLLTQLQAATNFIFTGSGSFAKATNPTTLSQDFFSFQNPALPVFANGFTSSPTGTYVGIGSATSGLLGAWASGTVIPTEFTATDAGNFLINAADQFEWTENFYAKTSLGSNDAARRAAIVTALEAVINGNQSIRAETVQYNLVLCPGYPETAAALQNLVVSYQHSEVLAIGDTPMNLEPSVAFPAWASSAARVIDANGNICYYYPHVLTTNLDGATILLPSSVYALAQMAYSDNVSYEWFAPAGIRRGTMSGVTDIGYYTGVAGTATTFVPLHQNQGQRDVLYGYTASGGINPLVFFPGTGFLIWGQKTSTGTVASALDRINVSRLVKYISRSLRISSLPFVFEPNDALTRQNLKSMVDGFLGNLIVLRGLYDFSSICSEYNNTPTVIDNNQLVIDIAIKPVKSAEFIYVNINVVATGANIGSSTNGSVS